MHIVQQAADEESINLQASALALVEGVVYLLRDTNHICPYFQSVDQDTLILGYLIKNFLTIVNWSLES